MHIYLYDIQLLVCILTSPFNFNMIQTAHMRKVPTPSEWDFFQMRQNIAVIPVYCMEQGNFLNRFGIIIRESSFMLVHKASEKIL